MMANLSLRSARLEHGPGAVVELTAGARINLGAELQDAPGGRVVTLAGGHARGRASTSATARGAHLLVELY